MKKDLTFEFSKKTEQSQRFMRSRKDLQEEGGRHADVCRKQKGRTCLEGSGNAKDATVAGAMGELRTDDIKKINGEAG